MANTAHPNAPDAQPAAAPTPQQSKTPPPKEERATLSPERRAYLAQQYNLSTSQLDVMRNQICAKATDEELEFFLLTAKRLQLDPFTRQIYFVKRAQRTDEKTRDGRPVYVEVGRPEMSIDGFRSTAEATGEYAGQDPIEWCDEVGTWSTVWLSPSKMPIAARCTIYRKGWERPIVAVAHFVEYAPTYPGSKDLLPMWARMGVNQIAKCAEALGFRKAFPRTFAGIYVAEEMQQSEQHAESGGSAMKAVPSKGSPAMLEASKTDEFKNAIDAVAEEARQKLDDKREPVLAKKPAKKPAPLVESVPGPAEGEPPSDRAPEETAEHMPAGAELHKITNCATRRDLQELMATPAMLEWSKHDGDGSKRAAFQKRWNELALAEKRRR